MRSGGGWRSEAQRLGDDPALDLHFLLSPNPRRAVLEGAQGARIGFDLGARVQGRPSQLGTRNREGSRVAAVTLAARTSAKAAAKSAAREIRIGRSFTHGAATCPVQPRPSNPCLDVRPGGDGAIS